MKKVSVIIPCYNADKWLPKCFLSLVGQTMEISEMELIFVDDASTDGGKTWELLLSFERAYPDSVIIIRLPENRRQGGARNEALKYASGEYLAFVDADDWVKPELYETAYRKAKELDADIVQFNHCLYADRTGVFNSQSEMEEEFFEIRTSEERKRLLLSEKITYGCWNKLYKRELVQRAKVRYAEHVVYEEPLFVYPLLYYGTRFFVIPDRLYIYRQNASGTMRRDMEQTDTLMQHARVQHEVWKFMKQTRFFEEYYEELKLYFLHSFLYETIYFAGLRELKLTTEQFRYLEKIALEEAPDIDKSAYEEVIPCQMRLYRMVRKGITEKELLEYMGRLTEKTGAMQRNERQD